MKYKINLNTRSGEYKILFIEEKKEFIIDDEVLLTIIQRKNKYNTLLQRKQISKYEYDKKRKEYDNLFDKRIEQVYDLYINF